MPHTIKCIQTSYVCNLIHWHCQFNPCCVRTTTRYEDVRRFDKEVQFTERFWNYLKVFWKSKKSLFTKANLCL